MLLTVVMKRTLDWLSVHFGKELELPQPRFLLLGNGDSIHSAYFRGCEQQLRKYTVNSNGPWSYALVQCLSHVGPSVSFSLTWTFSGQKLRWRQDYIPQRKLVEYFPTRFLMLGPLGKFCVLILLTPPAV